MCEIVANSSDAAMLETADEFACDACENANSIVIAQGYCADCLEYLCANCIHHHKKLHLTRLHRLQEKSTMPKHRIKPKENIYDTEFCHTHDYERTNYICKTFNKTGCARCMLACCGNYSLISNVVQELENNTEFQQVTDKLSKLANVLDNEARTLKQHSEAIQDFSCTAKGKCAKWKESTIESVTRKKTEMDNMFLNMIVELNKVFTAFETQFHLEIEQIRDIDEKNMKLLSKDHTAFVNTIQSLEADLKEKKIAGKHCQLFTSLNKSKPNIQQLEDSIHELTEKNMIHKLQIEPPRTITGLVNDVKQFEACLNNIEAQFDNVIKNRIKESTLNIPNDSVIINKYKIKISDLNARANEDSKHCVITCLIVLNDTCLLAGDYNNRSVKLIDMKRNTVVAVHALPDYPWSMAKVKNNTVAITIPNLNKLRFLSLSASGLLIYEYDIMLDGYCYGIVYSKNTLIVTFRQPGKVQILKENGKLIQTFLSDQLQNRTFSTPDFVALSPDENTVYVVDCLENSIISMTLSGKVKAIYREKNLQQPRALVVDKEGLVYVCGYGSHNLLQLSADLSKGHVWLTTNELEFPFSITIYSKDQKLYVGMNSSDFIKIYTTFNGEAKLAPKTQISRNMKIPIIGY